MSHDDTLSKGVGQITVFVNGKEHEIPRDVTTEPEICSALLLNQNVYALYWDSDKRELTEDDRLGAWEDDLYNAPPVVLSDGDEIIAVPKTCSGGG